MNTEGNKIIAEFMGKEAPHPFFGQIHMGYQFEVMIDKTDWWNKNALQFHTSWDWLMPVVIEFNKKGLYYELNYPYSLDKEWLSVVEFIQWYNTNKTPQ